MESILFVSSNKIFFDYLEFNKIVSLDTTNIYGEILQYIVSNIQSILSKYDNFEMHVSLYQFNITSLTRHKDFIAIFSERPELFESSFTELHIYYTPSIIDSVMNILGKCFKNPYRPKIVLHSKKESAEYLRQLFNREFNGEFLC
jgi:hypothetical protein